MDVYFILVIILFALAITDLVVGVSNDAVNFLNSAIGSQAGSRRTIMIVASLGVFIGASFSGGMMEVARKGIFSPDQFVFADIMAIFLAVMLTDIILLDVFNTLGMPTSTTVSIVFELLGASVAVALLKIADSGDSFLTLGQYINSSKATAIISGIFISIGIAFTIGALVMWLSRVLFSFQYKQRLRYAGAVWGGIAFAVLSYFLLFKGLHGASFVPANTQEWVGDHALVLLGGSFVFWTLVLQACISLFKWDIFRGIVLFGTFSLAMAFAGNDLVNFIGVPVAGLESYQTWSGSSTAPDAFNMASLAEPVRTQPWLLLMAGIIMVLTLWFSKKARSVTETEVNLGRQDEGAERFRPNFLARALVRVIHRLAVGIQELLPTSARSRLGAHFEPLPEKPASSKKQPPAFDLIRAAVNLTVASALISLATSLKLPLSTTYVSFMVAMGTSLADRAWGRDSAVFRVAGVLNVIAGWLMTALIAFAVAAIFAWLIKAFGIWAVGVILALAVFMIARSFAYHRAREQEKTQDAGFLGEHATLNEEIIQRQTVVALTNSLANIGELLGQNYHGVLQENLRELRQARKSGGNLRKQNIRFRQNLFGTIRKVEPESLEASRQFILAYDLEQDILGSLGVMTDTCFDHVANVHDPLAPGQQAALRDLLKMVQRYLKDVSAYLQSPAPPNFDQLMEFKDALLAQIESLLLDQNSGVAARRFSSRNSLLMFTILLETKDIVAIAGRFAKLRRQQVND